MSNYSGGGGLKLTSQLFALASCLFNQKMYYSKPVKVEPVYSGNMSQTETFQSQRKEYPIPQLNLLTQKSA